MNAREQLGGFILLSRGYSGAKLFFRAAQARPHGAVVELLALAVTHPAFG